MPRNIEVKVATADLAAARAIALRLGARPAGVDDQVDRYFVLDGGHRVKLRTCRDGEQLVRYARAEDAGVRPSDYTIVADPDPSLVPAGAPLAVVRKRRELLLLDNVRIHLDTVDDLGSFLELEAVVDAGHDDACCRAQVETILAALGVDPDAGIRASYAELLRAR